MTDWDKRFLSLASHISSWSKDTSTKVGAVIISGDPDKRILSVGYNGPPRGVDDNNPEYHERPLKYSIFEHSERNAIYNAAANGVSLKNSKLYTTLFPCADCSRAIIQSGISSLITYTPDLNDVRWGESFKISKRILEEVNIAISLYEQELFH